MAKRRSASELAQEWRKEAMEFDAALIQHLVDNLGLMPDLPLVMGIGMALSWINMRQPEAVLDLPGYPQMSAQEVVKKFGVEPFLEK